MKVDHIGYAVKDIERARSAFEALGFIFGEITEDEDRNVRIAFGKNGNCRVELVAPWKKESSSPVDHLLKKTGPSPYHLCYQVRELDPAIGELQQNGFHLILAPAAAFGGARVAFLMSRAAGMIELLECGSEDTEPDETACTGRTP